MDALSQLISDSPIISFTILLLVTLTVPPIFERLRLPGLVGLLAAGVLLGPGGLDLLDPNGDTEKLLSDVGKIYLMFVAGLEIDLREFRKTRNRSLAFGLATFTLPLACGTALGRMFGFGWNPSILIGSLLASHTLLAYPIVQGLGVAKNQAVTVTVGATIFTDIAALLVLAICVGIHAGEFSYAAVLLQVAALGLYAVVILFGLDWLGKVYFRRTGDEEGNQFLFVLLAVFLTAMGAQLINIDPIVGAFLAGLAVNDVVGDGPVKEKVEFVGGVLFIPFFFVCMGLLLDLGVFAQTLTSNLAFTLGLVGVLIGSKFLASLGMKGLFRYDWTECLSMWALSLPQVAATLAAALAGLNAGLIDLSVFNGVIVLMLVTSTLGPILTVRFASRLPLSKGGGLSLGEPWESPSCLLPSYGGDHPFTVMVAVSNPHTEKSLIEMGGLLAQHEGGVLVPLVVAQAHVHMDEPMLDAALGNSDRLLQTAQDLGQNLGVQTRSLVRIDDDVAQAISRSAKEQKANLVLMGWSPETSLRASLRARLLGTIIDSVFWSAHCPVAVARLLVEPKDIHRILVPVKILTAGTLRTVNFAQLFAATHAAAVTLLHVCDRRTPADQVEAFEHQLKQAVAQTLFPVSCHFSFQVHDDPAQAIVRAAQSFDLVVLRSMRRRTAGGLGVSDVTHTVIRELDCSMVLFGEPHS